MAKFAFMVPPLSGHVNPTISIGAELLKRGHEVAWIGLDEQLQYRLPKGGRSLLLQDTGLYQNDTDLANHLHQIHKKPVTGIESVKFLYEEVLVPLNRFMYKGIVHWLEHEKPDVAVNDHQLFSAAFAAHQLGMDYATIVTAPAAVKMQKDLPGIYDWEQKQMQALQHELQILGTPGLACSEKLTLVLTAEDFFGDMVLPDKFKFTGPATANRVADLPFDWDKFFRMGMGMPRVLVSIGTTFDHQYKRDFFDKVRQALGGLPVQVLLLADPELFDSWPPNFMLCQKIPQVEVLPFLDAVICHGGHNTVCESLSCGLPLVVVPIAYDQSYVAGRVVDTGCGLRLNYKRFKPAHLKEAVMEILLNGQYRLAATRLQEAFLASGGTEKAASMLEGLLYLN